MKNNYLLEGSDYVSLKQKIDSIIEKNDFKDAMVSIYDLDEVILDNALEDLDTYGFLSSKKVIIIKNISNVGDDDKNMVSHLIQYINNPDPMNLFIITDNKLDDRKKLTKELKKNMEYVLVSMNTVDYIKKELSSYKLESGVITLINEYSQDDITKIHNDCCKLKEYRCDTLEISKDDVRELCIKKIGDTTSMTFDFVRAFAEKNKKKSLEIYNKLIDSGVEALSIIGLIASQIRILYQVKVLSKKRLSDKEMADMLGEKSSYRITKTKELTGYYTEEQLLDIMKKLSDIDFHIKTDGVDSKFLIELLIINL